MSTFAGIWQKPTYLCLFVLLAACGCASAPRPETRTIRVVEYLVPDPHWNGVVYCKNGIGTGWLNINTFDDAAEVVSTIVHEKKHIEHAAIFKNCKLYDLWYWQNRLDAEAEAFCASIAVDTLPPRSWTPVYARARYAGWLSSNYTKKDGTRFTHDAAVEAVGKFCG